MDSLKYGLNLKNIRLNLGLTHKGLATLLDIEAKDITHYETGQNAIPLEHVEKLCLFYNLEYELFFEDRVVEEGSNK